MNNSNSGTSKPWVYIFCKDFQNNTCVRGEECRFMHNSPADEAAVIKGLPLSDAVVQEAFRTAQGPNVCNDFKKGSCKQGRYCRYLHIALKKRNRFVCPVCTDEILAEDFSCFESCNHVICARCANLLIDKNFIDKVMSNVGMCRGFLFGRCYSKTCKFQHHFLKCHIKNCISGRCKFFHFSEEEWSDFLRHNRPFHESVVQELSRIAYIYLNGLSTDKRACFCDGKLLGGHCSNNTCKRCSQKVSKYPQCVRCYRELAVDSTYRLSCNHVVCEHCLSSLPLKLEALAVHECPKCNSYGLSFKLY
ncbi:hypothetical protein FQR65_LT18319 [Abscondita terminalis]|nr:hypothetical protein FQR65_LT16098 [Abscondita terminalis]KAF5307837.1 hypothetical protein FQR65_LT18319 [Abscondita terminalis]